MAAFANNYRAVFKLLYGNGGYCYDIHTCIDTDIRKAKVLQKCFDGIPPAAIAEEYGCSESMVYADIRENERRLAAMLFDTESDNG